MLLHGKSVESFFVSAVKLRFGILAILLGGVIGCSQDEPEESINNAPSGESPNLAVGQIVKKEPHLLSDENSSMTVDRNFSETIISEIEQNGTGLQPVPNKVQQNESTTSNPLLEDANQSREANETTDGNSTGKVEPNPIPLKSVKEADTAKDSNRSTSIPQNTEKKENKNNSPVDLNETKPHLEPVPEDPSSDSNQTNDTIENFDLESFPKVNFDDQSVFDRILSEAVEVIPEIRPNGTVEFFEPLKKDPFRGSGWVAIYGANGKKVLNLIQIEKGKTHGLATEWHPNGSKKSEGFFRRGKRHGTANDWFENGQMKAVGNFIDGKREGVLREWHPEGSKAAMMHFKNGRFHGESSLWYATEQQERRSVFENGNLKSVSAWLPNGDKCPVTKVDLFGNGVVAKYDLDGNERYRIFYREGKRQKK